MLFTFCMTPTIRRSSPVVLGTRSPGFNTPRRLTLLVVVFLLQLLLRCVSASTQAPRVLVLVVVDNWGPSAPINSLGWLVPLTANDAPSILK